jgi:hypothetical protein
MSFKFLGQKVTKKAKVAYEHTPAHQHVLRLGRRGRTIVEKVTTIPQKSGRGLVCECCHTVLVAGKGVLVEYSNR